MREDDVFSVEMSERRMERVADVFESEREMSEEREMEDELPDIFMSVRLSLPSV